MKKYLLVLEQQGDRRFIMISHDLEELARALKEEPGEYFYLFEITGQTFKQKKPIVDHLEVLKKVVDQI